MAADAAKRNSFRAAKNQKIASDFLIFCRSLKFYSPPGEGREGGDSTFDTASKILFEDEYVMFHKSLNRPNLKKGPYLHLVFFTKLYP
jgi:hypothetical protein